jgi:hypothetical protein
LALVTFKAIRNCDDSQLSSQLSVVGCLLLVDCLKSCDLMLCVMELLRVLSCLHVNSGDKPKGHSLDGSTDGWVSSEEWVESKDSFSHL